MSWQYPGFASPTYTQIPDEFFDQVMCHLTDAELRVLLYIMRRTFGFKKTADAISYNQFLRGINTRDGQRLDEGCGLAAPTNLSRALKGLEDKGLISARRGTTRQGDKATTVYALRFRSEPLPAPSLRATGGVLAQQEYPGAGVLAQQEYPRQPVLIDQEYPPDPRSVPVLIEDQLQETEEQHTGKQHTDHNRTTTSTAPLALDNTRVDDRNHADHRTAFTATVDAASVALGEARKKKANRTRAGAITQGVAPGMAVQLAERALVRVQVQQEQETIAAPMAYYFSVLTDLVQQAQAGMTGAGRRRRGLAGSYAAVVRH